MLYIPQQLPEGPLVKRVRAIILTESGKLLFIKRVKPNKPAYWVAPGGGVEDVDDNLLDCLHRELFEELGAEVDIISYAFELRHQKGGKNLEEHFYICRLVSYDISLRNGPEFNDPSRGEFIPVEVEIDLTALRALDFKTPELRDWLIANHNYLHRSLVS